MSAASSPANDIDVIRPPTPRLTRAALVGLALVAGGSFLSGFARQVVGPLTAGATAEAAAPVPVQAVQLPPPQAPIVQPAMQVAGAGPPRAAPKAETSKPPAIAPPPPPVAVAPAAPPEPTAVAPSRVEPPTIAPAAAAPAPEAAEPAEPPA